MSAALSILVLAFCAQADASQSGALVPIEQGVADRSATATSLKVQPVELSQSTNFQKLFGVAGRPDLFVRSQGGLYAVFDQGSYRTVNGTTYIQWPAGTTFHIGQPNFTAIKSGGIRGGQSGANPPPGIMLQQKSSQGPDLRIGDAPVEGLIKVAPMQERVLNEPASNSTPARVPVKDVGFGHNSVEATSPAIVAPVNATPAATPNNKPAAARDESPKDATASSPPKS